MPFCPSCSLEFQPHSIFCIKCGASLAVPPPVYPSPLNPYWHLEGISGWLLFVAFSLLLTPFYILRNVARVDLPIFHHGTSVAPLIGTLFLFRDILTLASSPAPSGFRI
jgi:hypothetical protein